MELKGGLEVALSRVEYVCSRPDTKGTRSEKGSGVVRKDRMEHQTYSGAFTSVVWALPLEMLLGSGIVGLFDSGGLRSTGK